MNIGLFTDTYFPQINGVATSVHTLAGALRARGHHVYIFTPKDPHTTTEQKDEFVIPMPSLPFMLLRNYRVGLVYSPRALNQISHLHLDVVHTQTEFPLGIFGKLLSSVKKIPMVHTYHTMYEDYVHYIANGYLVTPAMAKEFSKLFCNSATTVVAPTEKAKHFLEEYGVTKPIEIIPTGIDTTLFAKKNFLEQDTLALKTSLGLEADTPVILSLGRVAKEKSIDVILRALPKLFEKIPAARMVIVGDGPEKENLEQLAKELEIGHKVLFIGAKPWAEIGKYYQIGTVFCSASVSETQGLTFAEAMAGGIPVIAKKDESIENIIEHNKTGLLFETEEDLTEKLYLLLSTPALQKRLSDASLNKMELLSVEAFAEHMEQLYEKTISMYHSETTQEHFSKRPLSAGVKAVKSISGLPKKVVKKGLYLPLLYKNIARIEENKINRKENGEFDMPKWEQNLRQIEPYVPGEQSKDKDIIKLNANENPYPPSPKAIEAFKNIDANCLRLYPNANSSKLKTAIAKHFHVRESQVFVGNGSDEVIAFAFMACFHSSKPILFPDITYSFYPVWCSLLEIDYNTIPLDKNFQIDIKDYFRENGGIILPNPNAPTGIGQKKEDIVQLLEKNKDSVIIIDEAYVDFGAYSAIELLDQYPNLLIVHTFSKSRSLAGMRIGMAMGSEKIIQTLEAVKNSYNSYTMDSVAIEVGAASILDEAYFKETCQKIIATRERTTKALQNMGFSVFPSQSNFLFVTHSKVEAKEIFETLKEKNIFIRYFNLPRINNHLRITIGTDKEMDILLQNIEKIIKH